MFRIHVILVRIRIRGSITLADPAPDPELAPDTALFLHITGTFTLLCKDTE
jgi:hypothetical protein